MGERWTKQFYTSEEDAIIREMYATHTAKEIRAQFLPHRSIGSIQGRGRDLGIQKVYEEPAGITTEAELFIDDGEYKRCGKCHRSKQKKYFRKDRTRPDGLSFYCKKCNSTRGLGIKRTSDREEKEVLEQGVKRCTICEKVKPLDQFYRNKNATDGRWSRCKVCDDARKIRSYEVRSLERLRLYPGFTVEAYQEMLEAQNGVCACCGQPETAIAYGKVRALAIDHDHHTGAIRGLLCQRCNVTLGQIGENPDRLKALLKYVEERCLW